MERFYSAMQLNEESKNILIYITRKAEATNTLEQTSKRGVFTSTCPKQQRKF